MSEKMDIKDARAMARRFHTQMEIKLEEHHDEKTIQWPDLSVMHLLERAEYHTQEARMNFLAGLPVEAEKHLAHAGNYLAMAFDNISRTEAKR